MAGEQVTAGELRRLGSDGLPETARSGSRDYAGDKGFVGVNMRLEPYQLPPGYVSEAVNMRFTRGVAETRRGVMKLGWMNTTASGSMSAWGTVYGCGEFRDPSTRIRYTLMAADGAVYFTSEGNAPQTMTLPAGVTITYEVRFVQCQDASTDGGVVVMLRGKTLPPLVCKGVRTGWVAINQSALDPGDGTLEIPAAERGLFFRNRLWLVTDDAVVASDIGNFTRYSIQNRFPINAGDGDVLLAIKPLNNSSLICWKQYSVHALAGITADLSTVQAEEITSQYGMAARDSAVQVGDDVWWLSELGVMSLRVGELGKLQSMEVPVSDEVQPLIERINWKYASGSQGAYWNNNFYLATSLDDGEALGPELVGTVNYSSGSSLTVPTTTGGRYRYTKGANEVLMTNVPTDYTHSVDFTATGGAVTLLGTGAGVAVTASIRRLYNGTNNAVLVYQFLNKAWAGNDESDQWDVKQFFTTRVSGKKRLFTCGSDGWNNLYEETTDDASRWPYADVTVTNKPAVGNTLRVNAGTVVTAINNASNNLAQWGCDTLAHAITNLWMDAGGAGGYSPDGSVVWTAPNTIAIKTSTGVRYLSTNGAVPVVLTTGAWATVSYGTVSEIESYLVTRAVTSDAGDLSHFDFLDLDMQSWGLTYSVTTYTDGVEESNALVSGQLKDRTKWYKPFDKAAFDVGNADGRFMNAYRQDYSTVIDATGMFLGTAGIALELHQEAREALPVKLSGRSARVKVESSTGRFRLMSWRLRTRAQMVTAGSLA